MYGFPKAIDVRNTFVGRQLVTVTFSANTVAFAFDEDVAVTAENEHAVRCSADEEFTKVEIPPNTWPVSDFVGRLVREARVLEGGTLELGFEGGAALRFIEDESGFECYHLRVGEDDYTV